MKPLHDWPGPPARKVIQITGQGALGEYLALCDDGSIWIRDYANSWDKSPWRREPPIPQDDDLDLPTHIPATSMVF
jgi:hypothetical protein